jgi:hypothetical protein
LTSLAVLVFHANVMFHFIARAWRFRRYLLGNPTHMWNGARHLVALKERDMTTLGVKKAEVETAEWGVRNNRNRLP